MNSHSVPALPVDDAIDLAAGEGHVCALRASGTLACWGDDTFGQLGDGSRLARDAPRAVGLAGGASAWCAWSRERVDCWGRSDAGALGDGTNARRFAPVRMLDVP